jgi:very-short-patch-repair endonuclease
MAVNLKEKLEKWKTKLLDLSKRNPLLNFRFRKGTNLKIVEPPLFELWESFVQKEQKITFPLVTEEAAGVTASAEKPATRTKAQRDTVTDDTPGERQRALRNLKKKAQLFQEEQGINVLYMAFGFLRWNEKNGAKVYFDAPLILVPVTISWENIRAPFVLGLHEDEIVFNPTLKFMLEDTYGLKVPEFEHEADLKEYIGKLKEILDNKEWSIQEEVGVGLFHFLKLSMYDDLKKNEEAILNSKLIRAIAGDSSAVDFSIPDFSNLDGSDELSPMKTFQVVDADSSQQEAVLCAKKGISFILQGPPGTGKSQTITNIIAECLANGKKVLFVAEKMAALEVVYRRLVNVGLGDFCLIMHSHKANKKSVMNQFEQVLHRSEQKIIIKNDAYQELVRLDSYKQILNNYSREIYTEIKPLNKTIYDAYGELTKLEKYPDLPFSIADVRQISDKRFFELTETLQTLVRGLQGMDGDLSNNPWYGANRIPVLTNALRQGIAMNLQNLQSASKKLIALGNEIKAQLGLDITESHAGFDAAQGMLASIHEARQVPAGWLLDADTASLADEIAYCKDTQKIFEGARQEIVGLHDALRAADPQADFGGFEKLSTMASLNEHRDALRVFIENTPSYKALSEAGDLSSVEKNLAMLREHADAYAAIREGVLGEFEKDILTLDCDTLYRKFRTDYDSMFKLFNSDYRNDKKLIESMSIRVGAELSDEHIIDVLGKLRQMKEHKVFLQEKEPMAAQLFGSAYQGVDTDFAALEKGIAAFKLLQACQQKLNALQTYVGIFDDQDATLRQHYEGLYTGMETDWDDVRGALEWANGFRNAIAPMADRETLVRKVCEESEATKSQAAAFLTKLKEEMAGYTAYNTGFTQLFDNPDSFYHLSFNELSQRYEACLNGMMQLQDWIDYRGAAAKCAQSGLDDFMKQCEAAKLPNDQIVSTFQKRFYNLWLDSVLPEYPSVATFRRKQQDALIAEFKALDKKQFDVARNRISAELTNKLPSFSAFTSGGDEISILKRELAKQRRIMPVRRLFQKIPNLVRMLKPCLMMSPLTVSLFLESKDFIFDTVIFDEASQVCTENALGAIVRGKQVIIVGDSKQMPPTSFFNVSADGNFDEYDEENEEANDVFESLLDEASLLPEKTLLWHYRSRHEHLIAFSNAEIYQNRLVTFPSWMAEMPDIGVEYVHVPDGVYDRGGRKGNAIEAQKIAEMVFAHFEACKQGRFNRSLGVIAFGIVQQQAIEAALRRLRSEHPEYEEYFNEGVEEPFFVKSLENVQGDERDTIIFSIGYAKGPDGKMVMNFGPLGQQGGERRLNVAITRAKFNIKLVGSILPTDIDVSRITTEGPKLLKAYMEFAIQGQQALLPAAKANASQEEPLETAIHDLLVSKGYQVDTQVGCSGYRIDLAVRHPDYSGCYAIAIECDGASYHAAKTARERDRIRPDVLQGMGWKTYRIWSPDWVKDPQAEGQRLIEAVEDAIKNFKLDIAPPVKPPVKTEGGETPKEEEMVVVTAAEETDTANPYHFDPAPEVVVPSTMSPKGPFGRQTCLKYLITTYFPVHVDVLTKAIYAGVPKITPAMKAELQADMKLIEDNDLYKRKGDFFYPPVIKEMPARLKGDRMITHIAQDEIQAALLKVAKTRVGINQSALITETVHGFGFKQKTPKLNEVFTAAFEDLVSRGKVSKDEEGIVSVL